MVNIVKDEIANIHVEHIKYTTHTIIHIKYIHDIHIIFIYIVCTSKIIIYPTIYYILYNILYI